MVVHQGDMDDVEKFKTALKEQIICILPRWGYDLDVNIHYRDRTLEMFNYLDPNRVKIIYFSTASILKQVINYVRWQKQMDSTQMGCL